MEPLRGRGGEVLIFEDLELRHMINVIGYSKNKTICLDVNYPLYKSVLLQHFTGEIFRWNFSEKQYVRFEKSLRASE